MAGNEGVKYTPEQTRFFDRERQRLIKQWRTKGATLRDPETTSVQGKQRIIVTEKQWAMAHSEMLREQKIEKKIVDRLKTAQPGEPRFESFIHLTALLHEPYYQRRPWNDKPKDNPLYNMVHELREHDEKYSKEFDRWERLIIWDYSYRLSSRTDYSRGLLKKQIKGIRDQRIAEIREERRQAKSPPISSYTEYTSPKK